MKLKKIKLKNIRSYESHEIEFPEGSTLLSGDIGAGKTSILLAIEFALFGLQPGQKGSSLLRNGELQGGVELNFEVDDKDVILKRTLKRSKSVSQDYCSISINGNQQEISVTELKSKVLDLINYPKEFAKKQNILYKFTVYTPQEGMKQIILQDPETRINTIRHVFGIDRYKRILENTSILLSKLREEKRFKEAMTFTLEQDQENLLSKQEDLESKRYNLISVEKELFIKKQDREKIEEENQEISKKIEEKNKLQSEIEKTTLMISTKEDLRLINKKTIGILLEQIKELDNLKFDESQISRLEDELNFLRTNKNELNEQNISISSQISSLNLKNNDNFELKNKISGIEMCPTCLQDVDPVHKSNVINQLDSNTSENAKKIKSLNLDKIKLIKQLSKIDQEIASTQNKIQELKLLKIKMESAQEKKNRMLEMENSLVALKKDIELLKQHIDSLKNVVFDLSKFENAFQVKKQEFEKAFSEERRAEIQVVELKKEIDFSIRQIQELKEKISKAQGIKLELASLSNLETWLNKNFIFLISNVEKNVMTRLRTEFSRLFSEWFLMLVPDNFNVRLDDKFTPIIEQQDYELDYAYLSGGERTAIALAYRLALNQVINSILSKIKTRDLVILDEPTDGFSEQQLDKMREVLEQLNVAQLIIVSHEQKIEGFVENVIKLEKQDGVSKKAEAKNL